MAIEIPNYSDSDKVPGAFGETVFGVGPINILSLPITLLLAGQKSSAGTMTADTQVVEVSSSDEANLYAGVGSELARMATTAIAEAKGYRLMIVAIANGDTPVAATATITLATTATSNGTLRYWVVGELVEVSILSGTAVTAGGDAIAAAFNAKTTLPVTAANNAGEVTLTAKCPGTGGNTLIVYQDVSLKPSAMTSTLAGGAAVLSSTPGQNGVYFASGSVAVDVTNALTTLFEGRYHRIAIAQNDATNLGRWETQIDAKAGVLEGRMEHVVVGHNGAQGAATSIAQTTLNNARFQVVWLQNSEQPPSELAAAMAAVRASQEASNPNRDYDDYEFATLKPLRYRVYNPSRTIQQSCLDNGVTPFKTVNTNVRCVRAITTRCLDGVQPDYRTIDVGMSATPDQVRDDIKVFWDTSYKPTHPYVRPNPGSTEPTPPANVATPALWSVAATGPLLTRQAQGCITAVAVNPIQSEYNYAANRIMSIVPVVVTPIQHAIGVSVRQTQFTAVEVG